MGFIKKKQQQQQQQQLTWRNARHARHVGRVNCPFNQYITLSNYKPDAYTAPVVLKSGDDNQSRPRILL